MRNIPKIEKPRNRDINYYSEREIFEEPIEDIEGN